MATKCIDQIATPSDSAAPARTGGAPRPRRRAPAPRGSGRHRRPGSPRSVTTRRARARASPASASLLPRSPFPGVLSRARPAPTIDRRQRRREPSDGPRPSHPRHPVERALQDVGGRHLVDDLGAALAAGVRLDQRAGARRRSTGARPRRRSGRPATAARLRTKARVAWARGPSLPSMLSGRPSTRAAGLALGEDRQERPRRRELRAARWSRAASRSAGPGRRARGRWSWCRGRGRAARRPRGRRGGQARGRDLAASRDRTRRHSGVPAPDDRRAAAIIGAGNSRQRQGDTNMKITWFGHSAFRIDIAGAVDPDRPVPHRQSHLQGRPARRRRRAPPMSSSPMATTTMSATTVEICKATGATLVANFEICMYLVGKGVRGTINPGNHGGTVDCGGFTVTFVHGLHSRRPPSTAAGLSRQSRRAS